jgi:prolyl oligopeptidase
MSAARLCPCRLRDTGRESRRDDRVHPGHARKMAAKLQAMGYEAYFYEPAAGGHGYGKDNKERASFTALGYNFLRRAIGWSA